MTVESLASFLTSEAGGGLDVSLAQARELHLAVEDAQVVVLSGVAGVGKSRLAEGYVRWATAGHDERGFRVLAVRPEWRGSTVLMGSYDGARDAYRSTWFLDMLLAALRTPERRFFAVLDGADLAPPEDYLSDVLLGLGGALPLALHPAGRCIPRLGVARDEANLVCHDSCERCFFVEPLASPGRLPSAMASVVPPWVRIPANFRILMTLQSERWTGGLDPMVLDRARVVAVAPPDLRLWLGGAGRERGTDEARTFFQRVGEVLERHGVATGRRSVMDVLRGVEGEGRAGRLDELVEGRFLPRVAAVTHELPAARRELASVCEDAGLRRSAARLRQTTQKP